MRPPRPLSDFAELSSTIRFTRLFVLLDDSILDRSSINCQPFTAKSDEKSYKQSQESLFRLTEIFRGFFPRHQKQQTTTNQPTVKLSTETTNKNSATANSMYKKAIEYHSINTNAIYQSALPDSICRRFANRRHAILNML